MTKVRGTSKNNKRLDNSQMFQYYMEPTENGRLRSYRDVSNQFNVDIRTVERIGTKHEWVKSRYLVGSNALKKYSDINAEIISLSRARLLQAWLKILTLFEFEIDKIDLKQQKYIRGESNKTIKAYELNQFVNSFKNASEYLNHFLNNNSQVVPINGNGIYISKEEEALVNRFLGKN